MHRYTPDEFDDADEFDDDEEPTTSTSTSTSKTRKAAAAAAQTTRRRTLSFAMPALVLLSLTYLSLHFPTQQCMLELVVARGRTNNNSSTVVLVPTTTTTTTTTRNQTDAGLLVMMALLRNATDAYYGLLAPPSHAFGVASFGDTTTGVGFLLAPSLLWLALTILVGSLLRVPSSACSTAAAYVLATVARRLAAVGWDHPLLYAALVLAKLGAGCALFDEFMALELLRCDRFQQALRFTDELAPSAAAAPDTAR